MIAFVKRLAGRLVLIGLGILAWQQADFQEVAGQQLRRALVWIVPGTEGRLQQYQQELEQTLEELLEAETRVQTQASQQATADLLRRDELARLDHLLACFRAASISGTKLGFPQQVFARSYTQPQILELVQELLNQRTELERQDSTMQSRLNQALSAVGQRISETRCHLQNMPIYLALGVAGDATGRSTQLQQSLELCLQSSRETLAEPLTSPIADAADCELTRTSVLSAGVQSAGGFPAAVQTLPESPTAPADSVILPIPLPTAEPAAHTAATPPPAALSKLQLGGIQATDFLTPTAAELSASESTAELTISELQQALRDLVRRSRAERGGDEP